MQLLYLMGMHTRLEELEFLRGRQNLVQLDHHRRNSEEPINMQTPPTSKRYFTIDGKPPLALAPKRRIAIRSALALLKLPPQEPPLWLRTGALQRIAEMLGSLRAPAQLEQQMPAHR